MSLKTLGSLPDELQRYGVRTQAGNMKPGTHSKRLKPARKASRLKRKKVWK